MSRPDVLVVGAGVSGLTTAVCLAETGWTVVVVADRPPEETTSAAAGAIWGLHSTETSDRAARWGQETLAELRALARVPGAGARISAGTVAWRAAALDRPAALRGRRRRRGGRSFPLPDEADRGRPAELAGLDGVRPCDPSALPPGYAGGWRYSAPLVHMPAYLGYLRERFERAGGRIEAGQAASLPEAAGDFGARVVVNCAGARAAELAGEAPLTPLRGQIVIAENPGLSEFFIGLPAGPAELVCLFPHGDTVVLGGTQTPGDWSLEPDPAAAKRILRDCAAVDPRLLARGRVLAHRVGLRPYRPRVRLEAEPLAGARAGSRAVLAVHNYGHGGAGVSLSWGCARQAAALAGQPGPA